MLHPQANAYRAARKLDGFWKFATDPERIGRERGFSNGIPYEHLLAVPGSWNSQNPELYHYKGLGWYETEFAIPAEASRKRWSLRFGAATFAAEVWLDGKRLGDNIDAFLPFEFDITDLVKPGGKHKLVVAVEGAPVDLTRQAITLGDFYEYAGLHRSIHLASSSFERIEDVKVSTTFDGSAGILDLEVETIGLDEISAEIAGVIESAETADGLAKFRLTIPNVDAWSCENPRLYELKLAGKLNGTQKDEYTLKIGFRTIEVKGRDILLNGERIFLKGFGKHEDSKMLGRASFPAQNVHDFNLMKWCGANSFRTSHYPYSEELLNLADEFGFLVLDETPFVSVYDTAFKSPETRAHAVGVMERLIKRDRNHPSVISWSIGNESQTEREDSIAFFKPLIDKCRELDDRPVTYVGCSNPGRDKIYPLVDIAAFNRYYGWYKIDHEHFGVPPVREGDLTEAATALSITIDQFAELFDKPLLLSEFGAEAIAGLHSTAGKQFSEEFQKRFIEEYLNVIEEKNILCGAHIWCFADFDTRQECTRVDGNKKGVFTRDREPKAAAFLLRERWNR